jgi:hypothetical protein
MKHVVLFSGGAASSYVAYLLTKEKDINKSDIVLLHTPTLSECEDSEKFRLKVARYLKFPMTVWGFGMDIWELIDYNNIIPGQFIPFCTRQLKQEMKEQYFKYLQSIGEEWIEYVGYGPDEWNRVQKSLARNEAMGRTVKFPLFEQKISSDECKRIIRDECKIELPSAYKTLKHNNCIPCFKGGKEYFKAVYFNYPEQYQKAVEKEEQTGYTVFKDISLKDLAVIFENDKQWNDAQYQMADFIPCECWT